MPSCSCSHWCYAPIYFAAALALVIAGISSSSRKPPPAPPPPLLVFAPDTPPDLLPDAVLALHHAGYHLTAALLHFAGGVLLPPGRPATLFAVPDAVLSNLSLPTAARLFRLHAVALRLPLTSLLRAPRGTCFPTLLHAYLLVTSSDGPARAVSLNGVPIVHPDVFVHGPHVVHGSGAAFRTVNAAACRALAVAPWAAGLVRSLGSRGYVSFSTGLRAVLQRVAGEAAEVDRVTVFAPRDGWFDFENVAVLEQAILCHVAVGRFGYAELAAMRVGAEMRSLARGSGIRVTGGRDTGVVTVNGEAIIEPDAYASETVVVHGVSRAFGTVPLVF